MPQRVIGGRLVEIPSFEFGPETSGEKASSELEGLLEQASAEQMSRYGTLRLALDGLETPEEVIEKYGEEAFLSFLHATLGPPAYFARDLDEMTPEQLREWFDSPLSVALAYTYAERAESEEPDAA